LARATLEPVNLFSIEMWDGNCPQHIADPLAGYERGSDA